MSTAIIKFRVGEYDLDGLISVAQVAAKCALSPATIYNEIKAGRLIAYHLADKMVLKPADVESWVRLNQVRITRMTPKSRRGRKRKNFSSGVIENARTQNRIPAAG